MTMIRKIALLVKSFFIKEYAAPSYNNPGQAKVIQLYPQKNKKKGRLIQF